VYQLRLGLFVSSTRSKEVALIQYLCCLCGRRIERGEILIRITAHRIWKSKMDGEDKLAPVQLEDGSPEKFTCPTCPATNGAPLALTGADNVGGFDV
jgi:hypothetical protein